jgi:hypothetical protein
MKLLMCAVFDSKVSAYSPPFCVKTKGEAIRSFSDAVADTNTALNKHRADYRLWLVGEFDDNTGAVAPIYPEALIGADEIL